MARYITEGSGRGTSKASRLGTEKTGINSHTRGWALGVEVHGNPSPNNNEKDQFSVKITGGSGGHQPEAKVLIYVQGKKKPIELKADQIQSIIVE